MNQQELRHFLEKMASGRQTSQEQDAFNQWVEQCSREAYEQLLNTWEEVVKSHENAAVVDDSLVNKIEAALDRFDEQAAAPEKQREDEPTVRRALWPRLAAAASIVLILSVGAHFLLQKKQISNPAAKNHTHDIAPGGNKAILTLANGTKIVLDNEKNGTIANQGGTAVNKNGDGQLVYNAQQSTPGTQTNAYDTLTTPRSGVYHITLADGSKVWLNSATSIRYPAAFSGKYRTVELLYGEAFFDVRHDGKMPFRVKTASQTTEDIGTLFDVNAYKDEPLIKTTLVEGAVSVAQGTETAVLKPGQQARILADGAGQKIRIVNNIDTDEIMAWKNGLFQFTNADIKTIMRQLARWYDVDVVYEGKVTTRLFTGDIHRNINASEAMQILTYLKINYRIVDKKIIITSNKTDN